METMTVREIMDEKPWLGLVLQGIGIVVVIGIPILIWGVNANSTMSVMTARLDRFDRDTTEYKTNQALMTNQMLELNKQLATISTQVSDIKDIVKGNPNNYRNNR